MWGNKLGWGISAGIMMFFLFVVYLIIEAGRAADPTAFITDQVLGSIASPVNCADVLPAMNDSTDSGELYWRAIEDYRKNPAPYDTIARRKKYVPADVKLPGVQALLQARNSNQATIFAARLPELITYDNNKDNLEALKKVADAVKMIGLLRRVEKQPDAGDYAAAVFSLGYKMYAERVRFEELIAGDGLMGDGLTMLATAAENAGDAKRAQALRDANGAKIDYFNKTLQPIWRVISSIDEKVIAEHPGDVMKLAFDARERMWRVEAVLKLGRQRYFSVRKGDQLSARRVLKQMADSEPDPAVKLAAQQARDLTIETYRMLQ